MEPEIILNFCPSDCEVSEGPERVCFSDRKTDCSIILRRDDIDDLIAALEAAKAQHDGKKYKTALVRY